MTTAYFSAVLDVPIEEVRLVNGVHAGPCCLATPERLASCSLAVRARPPVRFAVPAWLQTPA